MHLRTSLFGVLLLTAGLVPTATAQSLADVAKTEEARRQAIKRPTKVLTNKDLGSVPAADAPAAAGEKVAAAPTTPEAAKAENADAAKTGTDASKDGKDTTKASKSVAQADATVAKDQAYWSARMKALQTQLDQDGTLVDAMQTRVSSLQTDFVNHDDPAQRATIDRDRRKAVAELDRLKQNVQKDRKAIADLQEEARRGGVPPGWLR